jgi:hypothetical protein
MSIVKSGNFAHDATCVVAEATRQVAVAGANRAAVLAAEITFYRAVVASANANGVSATQAQTALRELGVGGI